MGSFSIMIGAGILALVSGYVLFKLAERGRDKDFDSHNALQILMFFLLISSLFLVGKSAYDDRNYCELVLTDVYETYKYGNNFTGYHWDYDAGTAPETLNPNDVSAYLFHKNISNTYDYVCIDNSSNTSVWIYRIPLFIIQMAGLYLIIYLFRMIYIYFKDMFSDKRERDNE